MTWSRNAISQDYESLARSAIQQSAEIALFKKRLEADCGRSLTANEVLHQMKQLGLKKATAQDDLTPNLVTMAVQIHDRMKGPEMLAIHGLNPRILLAVA